MSWFERRALVKILGAGKGREAIEALQREICSRWEVRRDVIVGGGLGGVVGCFVSVGCWRGPSIVDRWPLVVGVTGSEATETLIVLTPVSTGLSEGSKQSDCGTRTCCWKTRRLRKHIRLSQILARHLWTSGSKCTRQLHIHLLLHQYDTRWRTKWTSMLLTASEKKRLLVLRLISHPREVRPHQPECASCTSRLTRFLPHSHYQQLRSPPTSRQCLRLALHSPRPALHIDSAEVRQICWRHRDRHSDSLPKSEHGRQEGVGRSAA